MVNEKKIPICKRCHRRLKTPDAIERGMGKTCWLKAQTSQDKKPLFSNREVRKDLCNE
jgi:hypothetical protein